VRATREKEALPCRAAYRRLKAASRHAPRHIGRARAQAVSHATNSETCQIDAASVASSREHLLPVARCTNRLRRRAACCGVACLRIWAGGGGGVGLEEFAKRLAVRKRSVFYKSPLLSPPVLSCAALSDKATTLSTLLRASKISYMLKLLH
jgi:hypothetical protein